MSSGLFAIISIHDPDPWKWALHAQKTALYGMRVVQQHMMKRTQVLYGMMKIIVSHLRIAERRIIGNTLSPGPLQILRPIERRIQHVDLAPRLKTGKSPEQHLFQRWKILHRLGKNDTVELTIPQYSRIYIPVDKSEVGIIIEYPGRLLQLRKIDVRPRHLRPRYLRQLMAQPTIPAPDFQYLRRPPPRRKVPDKTPTGILSDQPFLEMSMRRRNTWQLSQLIIRIKSVLQGPDKDVFLLKKDLLQTRMTLYLNIG